MFKFGYIQSNFRVGDPYTYVQKHYKLGLALANFVCKELDLHFTLETEKSLLDCELYFLKDGG